MSYLLPWCINNRCHIIAGNGLIVADIHQHDDSLTGEPAKRNLWDTTEFIVRAVNSHGALKEEIDRLKAELHDCINASIAYKISCDDDTERTLMRTLHQARNYLAKHNAENP